MAKIILPDEHVSFQRWATTRAEDILLADAFLKVRPYVQTTDYGTSNFENHFFGQGNAISDKSIQHLNTHLRRKGHEQIVLSEGPEDSYSQLRGNEKSIQRCKLRQDLEEMSKEARADLITQTRRNVLFEDAGITASKPSESTTTLGEKLAMAGVKPPQITIPARPAASAAAPPKGSTIVARAARQQPPVSTRPPAPVEPSPVDALMALVEQRPAPRKGPTAEEFEELRNDLEDARDDTDDLRIELDKAKEDVRKLTALVHRLLTQDA